MEMVIKDLVKKLAVTFIEGQNNIWLVVKKFVVF